MPSGETVARSLAHDLHLIGSRLVVIPEDEIWVCPVSVKVGGGVLRCLKRCCVGRSMCSGSAAGVSSMLQKLQVGNVGLI